MRRFCMFVFTLWVAAALYAQNFKAYIEVVYSPIPRTASVIVGDSAIVIKDAKGQPRQFKTVVAVLNWLSKKGWRVEPINLNHGAQSVHTFLMSRENTSEKELKTMFR